MTNLDQTVQTLASIVRYSEMLLGLPDEDLLAGLDLIDGQTESHTLTEALTALAKASEALMILLDSVRRARERVLAATADRAKPN